MTKADENRTSGITIKDRNGQEYLLDIVVGCPFCPDGVLRYDRQPIECDTCGRQFEPQKDGEATVAWRDSRGTDTSDLDHPAGRSRENGRFPASLKFFPV